MEAIDTVFARRIYEGDDRYEERVKQAETSFKAGAGQEWERAKIYYEARLVEEKHARVRELMNLWRELVANNESVKIPAEIENKLKEWGIR